jgi:hypothetical protein
MLSWRRCIAKVGALCCTLTAASPSVARSGSTDAQAGVVIFWNAAKCMGGYHTDLYSAHCEPGPAAAVLDFKTKTEFSCVNNGAVDIRWATAAPCCLIGEADMPAVLGCCRLRDGRDVLSVCEAAIRSALQLRPAVMQLIADPSV